MRMILLDILVDPAQRQWVVLAIGLIAVAYLMFRPRFKKKDPLAKPPAFASLSQQRSVERQMQNLLVELSEMARQISAQLDTRSAKLELLIQEADAKIAQLTHLRGAQSDKHQPSEPQRESAVKPTFRLDEPVTVPPDPQHAEVYTLADQGKTARQIADVLNRPSGEIELILALRSNT
jgi:hypothetical protein